MGGRKRKPQHKRGEKSLWASKKPSAVQLNTKVIEWTDLKDITLELPTEESVGISMYVHPSDPVQAVLKQRYSDFHVSEIDPEGNIVRLTDKSVPQIESYSSAVNLEKEIRDSVSEAEIDRFLQWEQMEDKSTAKEFLFNPLEDKNARKAVHLWIKESYPELLSDSKDSSIRVVPCSERKSVGMRKDNRNAEWAKGNPQFVKFVLHKQNCTTVDAIARLSRVCNINSKVFTFAGTKDKRAITSQYVTVCRVLPEKLQTADSQLEPSIHIGNFSFVNDRLELGALKGNRFRVVLRDIQDEPAMTQSLERVRDGGFINYFGMQRFGTGHIPTHHIGKALIQDDFIKAARLLLSPRTPDFSDCQEAREAVVERRYFEASRLFPRHMNAERALCKGLCDLGEKQLESAFLYIPRNLRTMYTHAYQSYIWNTMTSLRIEEFGFSPVVGDLVYQDKKEDFKNVRHLTQIDIDRGEYSIFDVIMPLPGSDVLFPAYSIKEKFDKMLAEDGLTVHSFNHRVRELSLKGNYRNIMSKVDELQWNFLNYSVDEDCLLQSDIDLLEGNVTSPSDGERKAVCLEFNLPSSTYATMLFRELTKLSSVYEKDQSSEE